MSSFHPSDTRLSLTTATPEDRDKLILNERPELFASDKKIFVPPGATCFMGGWMETALFFIVMSFTINSTRVTPLRFIRFMPLSTITYAFDCDRTILID